MAEIPHELCNQLEDGTNLGSCDWGFCGREQVGWAQSDSDPAEDWLSICAECAAGNFAEGNATAYPVDRFLSFDDVLPNTRSRS